jgi:serine phosphatase RsbU (regulator of sigma subunit)
MESKNNNKNDQPKLWDTVKKDFKKVTLEKEIDIDLSEVLEFYLTSEQKGLLKEMKWYKRIIMVPAWLLKILFFKLTSIRRLLLLAGIVCLFLGFNNNYAYAILSVAVILFILILELKDKLIASDELIAGHAVQASFLPPQNPQIPGWSIWLYTKPANSVGGDMIDLISLDSNRYGLTLGDISGKELSAALYMVKLQSTIRAVASDYDSLSDLGKKINAIFYRDSEPARFATMIYLEMKPQSGKLNVLNAGHMPPLIMKEGKIEELPKGSIAIGVIQNPIYEEQSVSLDSGDTMIIFSDGITEAFNKSGDIFGKERLIKILEDLKVYSAEETGQRIISEIRQFVGKGRYFDDLSLAIIKRG